MELVGVAAERTTAATAAVLAIAALAAGALEVAPLQSYFHRQF